MYETDAQDWEEVVKKGIVVPLFKKGETDNLNIYR